MDILNQIIQLMTKEEVRHFKLFSTRTSVSEPRKDLQLYDYVRKVGEEYDEEKIFEKLYGKKASKNPFYRLKNRLLGDLNKSLNLQHIDDEEIVHIFHLLSLSRLFYHRGKYTISLHFIRKAEKKAIRLENYELLDFIYSELIKLSHEIVSINPEEYILLRKENREKLNALREIDDILAAVIYRLKVSLHYPSKENPIFDLLEKTVEEFGLDAGISRKDPKLRFTLFDAVSRLLLSQREYHKLEDYLLSSYEDFRRDGMFTKQTHNNKLQILVYLINTLYKNGKTELSLEYTEELREAMEEHNGFLRKKYLIFYYNGLVQNYMRTDRAKAIDILREVLESDSLSDSPFYEFQMLSNLAVAYFDSQEFSKAIKTLVRVYIHPGYKDADKRIKLNFAIFEQIVRYEATYFDQVEKGIKKIQKDYAEQLSQPEHAQERDILNLLKLLNGSPNPRTDERVQEMIAAFEAAHGENPKQGFSLVQYAGWLAPKRTGATAN